MMSSNDPDPGNGENKEYAYACCLIMITFVIIAVSLAMIICGKDAPGIVLLSDIRNWAGNDHIVIYTVRNINGQEFLGVEVLHVERNQEDS